MKKVVLFIAAVLFLTGCEATYTINIDDNYTETTSIIPSNTLEKEEISRGLYSYPSYYDPLFSEDEDDGMYKGIERYEKSLDNGRFIYKYKFGENYQDSNFGNRSVDSFGFVDSLAENMPSNIFATNFTKVFHEYPELTKLTVNIVTSKQVSSHNADYVNGNTYTWIITYENKDREIMFYFMNPEYKQEHQNSSNNNQDPNYDPNGNNVDPNNNPNNNNNKNDDNNKKEKRSNIVLYVLYSLFFVLIFVIIVFRKKFRK